MFFGAESFDQNARKRMNLSTIKHIKEQASAGPAIPFRNKTHPGNFSVT